MVGFAIATIAVGFLLLLIYAFDYLGWFQLGLSADDFDDRIKYLLSATAQVLAALFALVFSITLIAVQFVTKYTHRTMRIIFNNWIIFYMVVFAGSVVIPLIWLLVNPKLGGAIMSLMVGGIVVISLVPFFLYLRDRMKIDAVIEYLKDEGIIFAAKKEHENTKENINALDSIANGALTDRNYEVFELAVRSLAYFALELGKQEAKDANGKTPISLGESRIQAPETHCFIFKRFRENYQGITSNTRASTIMIRSIGEIGIEAARGKHWVTWNESGDLLVFMENFADLKENFSAAVYSVRYLRSISEEFSLADKFPFGRFKFIEKEFEIYTKHMTQKWKELVKEDINHVTDMIEKCIYTSCFDKKGFCWSCLRHFFDYLDFYIRNNLLEEAQVFCLKIGNSLPLGSDEPVEGLITGIIKRKAPEYLTKTLITKLAEYGDTCIKRKEKEWKDVGQELIEKVAWLTLISAQNRRYELCNLGLDIYLRVILDRNIPWRNYIKLFVALELITKSVVLLIGKKLFKEQDRFIKVICAIDQIILSWIGIKYDRYTILEEPVTPQLDIEPCLIERRNENIEKLAWKNAKPFINKLVKYAFRENFAGAMLELFKSLQEILWFNYDQELSLPVSEIFNMLWLTLAYLYYFENKRVSNVPSKVVASFAEGLKKRRYVNDFLADYNTTEGKITEPLKRFLKEGKDFLQHQLYLIGAVSRP